MQTSWNQISQLSRVRLLVVLSILISGLVFGIVQGLWWLVGIPVVILVLISSFLFTEKTLLFFGALAPLAVNFENLGGGMGMSLPTEPVYIFLFGLLLFHAFKERRINFNYLKHPLVAAITAYLLWLWISSVFSSMPTVSFKFTLARTWYITLFFYWGLYIFYREDRVKFFLNWFTIFTMIMVSYTLIMHAQDGFSRGSSYGVSWPFFPDHGMYAAAIAYAVFILIVYTFYVRQFGFHIAFAPFFFLVLLILLFAIIVSFTRATWLSLLVALGVWILTRFRVKFSVILIALVAVISVGIIKQDEILYSLEANKQGSSDELEGHVKSVSNITTDPSNLERINRWKCAGRMVSQKPVFGFGPGTFVFQYAPFQKSSELTLISTHAGDLGDAHSEYFSAMSETGFMGMLLWLSIVLITISTAFKIIYTSNNLKIKLYTYAVFLGLIAYHTHGVLNNYTQYDKLAVPMWAFTAILVVLDLKNQKLLLADEKST